MADPCLIAELLHRDHSVSSQRLKPARLQRASANGLQAEALSATGRGGLRRGFLDEFGAQQLLWNVASLYGTVR
jgi:hypothetical protein